MSIEISDVSATRKQCVIVYPSDEFLKDYQQKVRSFRGQLPGFRPGKVPQNVVEKRCGHAFRQELVDQRMRAAWEQIFKSNYEPIGRPEVVITPEDFLSGNLNEVSDISLTINFEVHPTVTPLEIDALGLTLEAVPAPTAKEFDQYVSFLSRQHAQESDKDGVAELGDVVYVDILYKKDDKTESDLRLVLHADEIHPTFVEKLQGAKSGDELEFEYSPVSYDSKHQHDENCDHSHDELAVKISVKKVAKLSIEDHEAIYKKVTKKDDFSEENFNNFINEQLKLISDKNHFIANEEKVVDHLLSLHSVEIPQAQYADKQFNSPKEREDFEKSIRCEYILKSYGEKVGQNLSVETLNFFSDIFCQESQIPPALFSFFLNQDKKFKNDFIYMATQRAVVKKIIDTLTPQSNSSAHVQELPAAKVEKKSSAKKSKAVEEKVKEDKKD